MRRSHGKELLLLILACCRFGLASFIGGEFVQVSGLGKFLLRRFDGFPDPFNLLGGVDLVCRLLNCDFLLVYLSVLVRCLQLAELLRDFQRRLGQLRAKHLNAIALRMRLDFSIGLQPRCLFTGRERVGGLTGTLFVNHPVSQFFPSGCCLRGLNDVVTILVMVAGQAGGLLSDRFRK